MCALSSAAIDPEPTWFSDVARLAGPFVRRLLRNRSFVSGAVLVLFVVLVSVLAGTFTLDQGITKGQQSCDNGTVLLSPQGSSALAFKFRRSDAPSPAGVLARTGT